jgi:7-cyano-7-deazaguanine reductase
MRIPFPRRRPPGDEQARDRTTSIARAIQQSAVREVKALRARTLPAMLTKLGDPEAKADRQLETFPTEDQTQEVTLRCGEFTCRCPMTGQPDWARITIAYGPKQRVVETKSVKLYLETFREEGIFHEHLATLIRDDMVAALDPRWLKVTVDFNQRGGIAVEATSSYAAGDG